MMGSSYSNVSTKVSMFENADKLLLQTKYIFQIPRDIQLSSLLISAFNSSCWIKHCVMFMTVDYKIETPIFISKHGSISCKTYFAVIEVLPKIGITKRSY